MSRLLNRTVYFFYIIDFEYKKIKRTMYRIVEKAKWRCWLRKIKTVSVHYSRQFKTRSGGQSRATDFNEQDK